MAHLAQLDWPGNIRQLENAVYRAVVMSDGDQLTLPDFPSVQAQAQACAPAPVTNREFIHAMRRASKFPGIFSLPSPALRICLGEMASVVLASQRMMPQRLLEDNFRFIYPDLSSALRQLLGSAGDST